MEESNKNTSNLPPCPYARTSFGSLKNPGVLLYLRVIKIDISIFKTPVIEINTEIVFFKAEDN